MFFAYNLLVFVVVIKLYFAVNLEYCIASIVDGVKMLI